MKFTPEQRKTYKAAIARFYCGDEVVGMGFYVQGSYLLTCAHVVASCIGYRGMLPETPDNLIVEVDFPFLDEPRKKYSARVCLWQPDFDIAGLEVLEALPVRLKPIPFQLSENEDYWDHDFHICGCPENLNGTVTWLSGIIKDETEANGLIQLQAVSDRGYVIQPGFSGSAVWSTKLQCAVGMVVARDGERVEAGVGFMIPYQRLKPALEAIALFNLLLAEADNIRVHWREAYRLLRPENSTEFPYPTTLQKAILQLQEMPPHHEQYWVIDEFLGYLAQPELNLSIRVRLVQWLESQGNNVDDLLAVVRQRVVAVQVQQTATCSPHLLFWVQLNRTSDRYSVQAYLAEDPERYEPLNATPLVAPTEFLAQTADETVDESEIEKILRACLEEIGKMLDNLQDLTINVFLPLSCLHWDVDCWSTTNYAESDLMGCRYNVVVRIAERWQGDFGQYRGDWQGKWLLLKQLERSPSQKRFCCGDGKTPKRIRNDLRQDGKVGLVLKHPPLPYAVGESSPFTALLLAGAPVALWPRPTVSGLDSAEHFDQLLGCCLSELPTTVRAYREAGDACDANEPHLGPHLGLIWEDPKLIPPSAVAPRLRYPA